MVSKRSKRKSTRFVDKDFLFQWSGDRRKLPPPGSLTPRRELCTLAGALAPAGSITARQGQNLRSKDQVTGLKRAVQKARASGLCVSQSTDMSL